MKLLSIKLNQLLSSKALVYNLDLSECDLLFMYRPWLSEDEFNVPIENVNEALEEDMQAELKDKYSNQETFNNFVKNKATNLKSYAYEDNLMDNYGQPIYNKINKVIGYKLNDNENALRRLSVRLRIMIISCVLKFLSEISMNKI